jgi:hypothetical protein
VWRAVPTSQEHVGVLLDGLREAATEGESLMTTRSYLPPTSTALAVQITDGWRGDLTFLGRAHKDEGTDVRHALRELVERASSEQGGGSHAPR